MIIKNWREIDLKKNVDPFFEKVNTIKAWKNMRTGEIIDIRIRYNRYNRYLLVFHTGDLVFSNKEQAEHYARWYMKRHK